MDYDGAWLNPSLSVNHSNHSSDNLSNLWIPCFSEVRMKIEPGSKSEENAPEHESPLRAAIRADAPGGVRGLETAQYLHARRHVAHRRDRLSRHILSETVHSADGKRTQGAIRGDTDALRYRGQNPDGGPQRLAQPGRRHKRHALRTVQPAPRRPMSGGRRPKT